MSAVFTTIGAAVQDVIANVSGAPANVFLRDTDVVHPDELPCVVVTMGDAYTLRQYSGAGIDVGDDKDQGDRLVAYQIGVSVYAENQAANQTLGTRQDFVEACVLALSPRALAGAPTVYGNRVERRPAWERRPFRQGVEKSVFLVTFLSAETRLGN